MNIHRLRSVLVDRVPTSVTVLFGGIGDCGSFCGDTWTWDGRRWSKHVSGPPERDFASMAYDAARGVTVLFGGSCDDSACGDTWTWDGRQWSQQQVSGPPARAGVGMTYDAARRRHGAVRGIRLWRPQLQRHLDLGRQAMVGAAGQRTAVTIWCQHGVRRCPRRHGAVRGIRLRRPRLLRLGGSGGCGGRCGDTWTLVGAPTAVASAAASSGLVSPPGVPSGVQATAVGPDSIRLDWQSGAGRRGSGKDGGHRRDVVHAGRADTGHRVLRGDLRR
jgi:hypothetical protein